MKLCAERHIAVYQKRKEELIAAGRRSLVVTIRAQKKRLPADQWKERVLPT